MTDERESVESVCAKMRHQGRTGDLLSWAQRILSAHQREIAARDATIAKLKAALHPGPMPTNCDGPTVARVESWGFHTMLTAQESTAAQDWCKRANRYEQLTGLKTDQDQTTGA